MNAVMETVTVHAVLSEYGDALLYGTKTSYGSMPALYFKHLLFARHEESFYGTELEIQNSGRMELVLLPAEMVLSFFADRPLLEHIEWNFEGDAELLARTAPALAASIDKRAYRPDFGAYRAGRLQWKWDRHALKERAHAPVLAALDRGRIRAVPAPAAAGSGREKPSDEEAYEEALFGGAQGEEEAEAEETFLAGVRAAYSAAVFRRRYGSEQSALDLRREYPRLFDRGASAAGLDEDAWLVAVGWREDAAPFRPVVRFLEPDEDNESWRLELALQDKKDEASLASITLSDVGEAAGNWPAAWDKHVRERGAEWLKSLRTGLPTPRVAAGPDILARGMSGPDAWQFLTKDSPRLLDNGWRVLLPAWWQAASKKKPKLKARVKEEGGEEKKSGRSIFGLDSVLNFDWRIAIGDAEFSEEEYLELAAKNERLVQFRGEWVALDPALLTQISRAMNGLDKKAGLSFQDILQLHLLKKEEESGEAEERARAEANARLELEVQLSGHLSALIDQLGQKESWPAIDVPVGLRAQLRGYQREGFGWLAFLRRLGLGACLADDMGLGKTVQLIAYLLHVKDSRAESAAAGRPLRGGAPRADDGALRSSTAPRAGASRAQEAAEPDANPSGPAHSGFARAAGEPAHAFPASRPGSDPAHLRSAAQPGAGTSGRRAAGDLPAYPAAHRGGRGSSGAQRSGWLPPDDGIIRAGSFPLEASLIICPTSLLGNWQKEIARFAPSLRVLLHYGSGRRGGDAFAAEASEADVILTSYATAALDQELLRGFDWLTICLDEAQTIKNAQTKQSTAIRSFRALHKIALTGTPIENRLSELWSIYDFMVPGYLGGPKSFQDRFANPIEKEQDEDKIGELQKLVKPFMLRRKKKDPNIQLDLPEKNEMKTYIHLTPEQSVLYEQVTKQLLKEMPQLEGMKRKGAILSALTQLKRLCDHPALTAGESSAAEPDEAPDLDTLIEQSAKLSRLVAMVKELRAEGERCLIFTQYIGMGEMMQRVLSEELGENVLYLNGSTPRTARERMIEQFQAQEQPANETTAVFILSLKAGGVGLNLTAANHVFHVDRWWNPAVENQATDRAYRMGQTKDVQVHKFISIGTLEERIDDMLESKQQLSDSVIAGSEGWITELSDSALRDLFTLRQG
ncbi:SNF2-related protein [Saccharibacillus sp. CPCC 101409]|uniref:DEAD/DEAH box helicase n=1 Tax=Saccharibacillus sp. CPCC 101409 TaxID=3058041 RepID=UPI002670DB10|nr:SNF2-related protein [Saccharibacillus sp. CPCC 101409]MDO3411600.1 SNF2-related protein [Saccharibacillus sp. CPCC 101409]